MSNPIKEENRYLFLEILFTFFLLICAIFLFGSLISQYRIYFILGLAAGFSVSWFTINKHSPLTIIFLNIGILGVFAWIIYSLLNSSLLYKDVVVIFIKGAFILQVILSFNIRYFPLNYIQLLSVPLFLCFPIFTKDYDGQHILLSIIYIVCWIILLRIKFYKLFNLPAEGKKKQYPAFFAAAILFLAVLSLSWALFQRLPLGRIEKGGFLLYESEQIETENEMLEKQYYESQDEIQKEIVEVISQIDSKEDRQDMLFLLSSLIKDEANVIETQKAELGLISHLTKPGPGLDKRQGEDVSINTEKFVDKKVSFNMKKSKDKIANIMKKNRFNIIERISVMNNISKMQDSRSLQELNKYEDELKRAINNFLGRDGAKRELRKSIGNFKEWKEFGDYRKKLDSLNNRADSSEGKPAEELRDLLSDINEARDLNALNEARAKAEKLKGIRGDAQKDLGSLVKEALDLKTEMLLTDKAAGLKEEIDSSRISQGQAQELEDKIDDMGSARDYQEFMKGLSEYREKIRENRMGSDKSIDEFLEIKAHMLINKKKERIKGILKESNLPDRGEELIEKIENMELEKNSDKLVSDGKKIKDNIDKNSDKGFISNASRDTLKKEIGEITDILLSMLEVKKEGRQKSVPREGSPLDYLSKLNELIDSSSLKEEKKESFKQLAKDLMSSKSIPQLDNIKKEVDSRLEELPRDNIKKEEIRKLSDAFESAAEARKMLLMEKSLSSLREKIEDLRRDNPEEAAKLEESLKKIRKSRSAEEMKKQIEALEEDVELENQQNKQEEKPRDNKDSGGLLDIYVAPSYLVMPLDSTASLKAVAVYNNLFIKEMGPEQEWVSSNPYVAWVDEKGTVHAVSKGRTQIYVKYSGYSSQKIEVAVVDKL